MIRLMLFDDVMREYTGRANHLEDTFSFLNRSSLTACARVRAVLEEWFTRYPDKHKPELRRSFRTDFSVAFFELVFHELLLRLGHKVDVHPQVSSLHGKRPDFFAFHPTTGSVFLEVTVVSDESREEKAKARVLSTLFDQINQMKIQDYFLSITEIRNPTGKQPSANKVKQFILSQLATLDYDTLASPSQLKVFDGLPRWTYKQDLLEIDFAVIPVRPESRGILDHAFIGKYPSMFRWGGTDNAIRKALKKKASKYGQLNTPFIIAINCTSAFGTDQIDEMQALFGTEEFVLTNPKTEPSFRRKPDGIWLGPNGPQNKKISGAIIGNVILWNLPKSDVRLFQNPWADHPYKGLLLRLPQARVIDGQLKYLPGESLGSILSLDDGWPGQLFDN